MYKPHHNNRNISRIFCPLNEHIIPALEER